jgi:hypothetical protein
MRTLDLLAPVALVLAFSGSACSSSSTAGTDPRIQVAGLNPTPPDANGFQLILPKVTGIKPGDSYEYCTWTDKVLDADANVKGTQSFQSPGGHHVVLFYTMKPQPAGTTRLCTDDDMTSIRFGIGGEDKKYNELPGDLAVRMPKGAQIVAQHHYINAGSSVLDAQSVINVKLADPGKPVQTSSSVVVVDSNLRVPVGKVAVDLKCTVNRDYAVWMLLPHMHAHGTYVRVEHTSGDHTDTLFDVQWQPEFEFHAPKIIREVSQAIRYKAGDEIRVHCEWNNDTGKEMSFGQEMCLAFGQTIDNDGIGNVACDGGQWTSF